MQASFRVVFEKAVVENDGGKFMLYTPQGAEQIVVEKKELSASSGTQGNISDLGGYYNFTQQAMHQEPITQASLADAAASLKFLLKKELSFHA